MSSFEVRGGKKLHGEIVPQGKKKRGPADYFGGVTYS